MVTREQIDNFASEIARRYSPEKIILFGSQARGTANEDSDVDMLVIMDFEGRGHAISNEMRSTINPAFRLDLKVKRAADIQWRIEQNDWFLQDVMKEGVVLHEAVN